MEQIDYAPLLPLRPSIEEQQMILDSVDPFQYIIYRSGWTVDWMTGMKHRAVKCSCTACGADWYSDRYDGRGSGPFGFWNGEVGVSVGVQNNQETICPACGAKVFARHVSSFQYRICDHYFRMTVGRVLDRLVLLGWVIQREADKDGRVYQSIKPYEAYVVEKKKVVKLSGYIKNITAVHLMGVWGQMGRCCDTWLVENNLIGFSPEILEGTTAENSKLDLYMAAGGGDKLPVSYLRLWIRHRNVENLLTCGAGEYLVREIMYNLSMSYGYYSHYIMSGIPDCRSINWREKKPTKMLNLNREELRAMIAGGWDGLWLEVYKSLRRQGPVELPADMERVRQAPETRVRLALEKDWPLLKMLRYCDKKKGRKLETLMDYWDMALKVGWNLEDDSLRWPRDLKRQHDKALEAKKEFDALDAAAKKKRGIVRRRKGFEKTALLMGRYSFAADGIMIGPCPTEEELIREGELLSHCVSMYAERISAGTTSIFLIRREAEPDRPWYTLELDPKELTVLQNHGKKNCDPTKEVNAFVELWKKTKLKKKESAA